MTTTRREIERAKNADRQAISRGLLTLKNKKEYLDADDLTKESMMETEKARILELR
jgi:hypothetical protein